MSSRARRLGFIVLLGLSTVFVIVVLQSMGTRGFGLFSTGGRSLEWLTDAYDDVGIYEIEVTAPTEASAKERPATLVTTLRGRPASSIKIYLRETMTDSRTPFASEKFLVFLGPNGGREAYSLNAADSPISARTAFSAALRPITDGAEIESIVRERMRAHPFDPALAKENPRTTACYIELSMSSPPMALARIGGIMVPTDLRYQTEHNELYWQWVTLKVKHPVLFGLEALVWAMMLGAAAVIVLRVMTFFTSPSDPKKADAAPSP